MTHSRFEAYGGKVYLRAILNRQSVHCLLDTGSQVTVLPARLVSNNHIQPTSRTLHAANGTDIPVRGIITTSIRIQGDDFEITGLVTDHVHEPMIGIRVDSI